MANLRLTKTMSYALRHNPKDFSLSLDDNGWTSLSSLLEGLRSHHKAFKNITLEDVLEVVRTDDKGRYEVSEGNIRALYGHSTDNKIAKKEFKPPTYLYHGTTKEFADLIIKNGLMPKQRQYVHLSEDIETANMVGLRRTDNPVILKINSEVANINNIKFYKETNGIWLADNIPSKYIEVLNQK